MITGDWKIRTDIGDIVVPKEHHAIATEVRFFVNECHNVAILTGTWLDPATGTDTSHTFNVPEKLMLIVSEISEAMEGHRKSSYDTHILDRRMIEVELADALIRIGSLAGVLNLDVGGAVAEKLAYNLVRPDHKREARIAPNGKKY